MQQHCSALARMTCTILSCSEAAAGLCLQVAATVAGLQTTLAEAATPAERRTLLGKVRAQVSRMTPPPELEQALKECSNAEGERGATICTGTVYILCSWLSVRANLEVFPLAALVKQCRSGLSADWWLCRGSQVWRGLISRRRGRGRAPCGPVSGTNEPGSAAAPWACRRISCEWRVYCSPWCLPSTLSSCTPPTRSLGTRTRCWERCELACMRDCVLEPLMCLLRLYEQYCWEVIKHGMRRGQDQSFKEFLCSDSQRLVYRSTANTPMPLATDLYFEDPPADYGRLGGCCRWWWVWARRW